jgi:hypothetical protein
MSIQSELDFKVVLPGQGLKSFRPIRSIYRQIKVGIINPDVSPTHSVLRLLTGLAIAARTACELTVTKAISKAPRAAARKIHQLKLTR